MLNGCCCLLVTKSALSLSERVKPAKVRYTEQGELLIIAMAWKTLQTWLGKIYLARLSRNAEVSWEFGGQRSAHGATRMCSSGCGKGDSCLYSSWQRCRNTDKQKRLSKTMCRGFLFLFSPRKCYFGDKWRHFYSLLKKHISCSQQKLAEFWKKSFGGTFSQRKHVFPDSL